MKVTSIPLNDKSQTAAEMYRLINKYYQDIDNIFINKNGKTVPVSSLRLKEFFDMVRKIPYVKDTAPVEVVKRPIYVYGSLNGDCKKKSILMGAYFKKNGIPFRLIGSSKKASGKIHHVFPQAKIKNKWVNMDATYNHYRPGEQKIVSKAEIL